MNNKANNRRVRTYTLLVLLFLGMSIEVAAQQIDTKETIVLIKGEAKRVLMDADGNIIKVIKDEPRHMDGLFVDRPPIPDATMATDATTQKESYMIEEGGMATSGEIHFVDLSQHIKPASAAYIDALIRSHADHPKSKFVIHAKVNPSDDAATMSTIDRMQVIRAYLVSQNITKNRVKLNIEELNTPISLANQQILLSVK